MGSVAPIETQHFSNNKPDPQSTYILLDVSDRGVVLPDDLGPNISLEETNLLIWAEHVRITKDISFVSSNGTGKNIGIACSSLSLDNPNIKIDVSGTNGAQPLIVPTQGTPGGNGGNAGSIWLYVENLNTTDINGLQLVARGGDGGEGGATSTASETAGNGGKGGNGGTISCTWGSAYGTALMTIYQYSSLPWAAIVGRSLSIQAQTNGLLTVSQGQALSSALTSYNQYLQAANSCVGSVNTLRQTPTPKSRSPLPSELVSKLKSFSVGLSGLLGATNGPDITDQTLYNNTVAADQAASKYLSDWKAGNVLDDSILEAALEAATTTWTGVANSSLQQALSSATNALLVSYQNNNFAVTGCCIDTKGTGGIGGIGYGISPLNGTRGGSGNQGSMLLKELLYNGASSDLDVQMAYAFPDQCQMLLNKANALYFTNTADNMKSASTLYSRLLRRLAFVPTMIASSSASPPQTPSAIEKSYQYLEYGLQVVVSAIDQLQSIYAQAKSFQNHIMLGKDMFAHDPTWAPRLTYFFYADPAKLLVETLKGVEGAYNNAVSAQTQLSDLVTGQNAATAGVQRAQDQITLLTNDNGPLTTSADLISQFTPLLAAKVTQISKDLTRFAADIKAQNNWDPVDIIGALSTVAMAPSVPLALVEGGKVFYDAFTTVKDNQGVTINKDYVITELGNAGTDLSSLSEAYTTRADHTIVPNDPGGLKLLAATDTIQHLYTEFQACIDPVTGKDLIQHIADLQGLVTNRNNAVVAYNAALELLHQACTDEDYYQAQQIAYGEKAAKTMNRQLPSILLWLRRTQDNYALETMRILNYSNRAIYYWGLVQPGNFSTPGPLQASSTFDTDMITLNNNFEAAISSFAGAYPIHWPVKERQGVLYQLNYGQIVSLLEPRKSASTGDTYYSVAISLHPGIADDSGDGPIFAGRANVRIDRVRVWMIGASVAPNKSGYEQLSVIITQLGDEIVQNASRKSFKFTHDPVQVNFVYDATDITSLSDCTDDKVLAKEVIDGYYVGQGKAADDSIATIGPWSTWVIEVRCADNSKLDMSKLSEVYIEFGGYSSPFKDAM